MSFCKLERPAPLTQELSSKRKEPQRVCGGQTSVTVNRDDQSHISPSSIHINIILYHKTCRMVIPGTCTMVMPANASCSQGTWALHHHDGMRHSRSIGCLNHMPCGYPKENLDIAWTYRDIPSIAGVLQHSNSIGWAGLVTQFLPSNLLMVAPDSSTNLTWKGQQQPLSCKLLNRKCSLSRCLDKAKPYSTTDTWMLRTSQLLWTCQLENVKMSWHVVAWKGYYYIL